MNKLEKFSPPLWATLAIVLLAPTGARAQTSATEIGASKVIITDCSIGEIKVCYAGHANHCCPDKGNGLTEMDVAALGREPFRAGLRALGLTIAQVLAEWDRLGISYDRHAAAEILAPGDAPPPARSPWGLVKSLYK